jgi:hypothetical protein
LLFFANSVCGRGVLTVWKKIGIKSSSDPPIIGLSGGHHGEEGKEEGEEVLTDIRHIRLPR